MKSIFVSSTFKDMQFERDLLHARVEPSLNAKLEDEGEAVYFGDLRWGVNTSELSGLESSQKVLDVCLDEIDGCKPFMIVFIGERYGWIPEGNLLANVASTKGMQARSGMSVTHLEIEYGALLRPDLKGRAFFYFRNLDTSNMPASVLKDYASESPANKAKLIALKQDISKAFPNQVREYDAKWDPQTNSVVGLETLADRIEKDLLNAFAADEGNLRGASWQQKVLRRAEEYFLEEPPLEDYESVFDVVSKGEESVCNIIQAQSGKGKTIYLRSHYAAAKRLHGQDRYFAAFVHGLDSYSMKAKSAFLVLQYRLETILGTEHSLTDDISEQSLFALIRQAAGLLSNPLHFYIDNADEKLILALHRFFGDFSESTYLQERQCGPKWKERLVFHVAYRSDQQNMYVSPNYFGTNIIAINGIAKGKEEVFLRYLAKQKHKELSPKVINEILKKEEANDPLYLRLMVDRLMMLDGSDFAVIRSMGDGMGAIDEYMVKVVKDAGDDVDSLTKAILNEAFRKVGGRFVRDLVSLLFWTGDYVPEKEIAK